MTQKPNSTISNSQDLFGYNEEENTEVTELLMAINLCHTSRVVTKKFSEEFITDLPEERAGLNFCSEIGFCIDSQLESSDQDEYLYSLVIQDHPNSQTHTFDILANNVFKNPEGDYIVSVLVTSDEPQEGSTLYVRGMPKSIFPKLLPKHQSDKNLKNHIESTQRPNTGYKFIYAKKKLNQAETLSARSDLQNLYCQ
jgi:magnesium-transporting ATPase (P-type)